MRTLQGLHKGKKKLNPDIRTMFSNIPQSLGAYIKKHGRLPLSVIRNYTDNTGRPITERYPKRKSTLFNVKPR